jgi:hypothetical protein
MRLRTTAIVLAAACSLFVPVRADEPAKADLQKYLPAGSGFYVHVNVRQFLAAPVIRKAIPLAVDKYGDTLMQLFQFAKAFDPNAQNIPNDKVKEMIDSLKKPETIAKAFDAAKDGLTDIVVAGEPGKDDRMAVVVKCHEAVTADIVKAFAPFLQNNPQVSLKMHDQGDKTLFELQPQNAPQPIYFVLPQAGVVVFSPKKEMVEKALKGGGEDTLKPGLKKLVGEKQKTDFVFFAMSGSGQDESGVVSGWGRIVLDKDVHGEMSATYGSEKKAADEAKEMNEHLGQLTQMVKNALGPNGKDVAAALDKAKATADGPKVSAKFAVPGSVIEKLLAKEKE